MNFSFKCYVLNGWEFVINGWDGKMSNRVLSILGKMTHQRILGKIRTMFTWFQEKAITISGCSDWFKSVLFKIEKIIK